MRYGPADSSKTPRYTGVRTFMRLPFVETLDDVDVAIIGVPIDDAVSFKSGARFGPEAIRSASALLRPYNQRLRVDVTEHLSMIDHGDLPTVPGYHSRTLGLIQEHLEPVHRAGVVPLCLGVVLRRPLLPRHRVQARGRGGAGRRLGIGAGGDARDALRGERHRGAAPARVRRHLLGRARAADPGGLRRPGAGAGRC